MRQLTIPYNKTSELHYYKNNHIDSQLCFSLLTEHEVNTFIHAAAVHRWHNSKIEAARTEPFNYEVYLNVRYTL